MKLANFLNTEIFENLIKRLFSFVITRKELNHDEFQVIAPPMLENNKYKLVNYIGKARFFGLAEYKDDANKKYIAKIWSRNFKDKSYFRLRNEYLVYKTLWNIIDSNQNPKILVNSRIRIPQLKLFHEKDNLALILLEKIEGKTINNYTISERLEFLDRCVEFLNELYKNSSDSSSFGLTYRRPIFFAVMLMVLLPIALIRCYKIAHHVLNLYPFIVKSLLPVAISNQLTFTHRDLHPWNIIKTEKHLYLLDFEISVIAPITHDLANGILSNWEEENNKVLIEYIEELKSKVNKAELKFMCIYSAVFDMVFNGTTSLKMYESFFKFLKTY